MIEERMYATAEYDFQDNHLVTTPHTSLLLLLLMCPTSNSYHHGTTNYLFLIAE